MNTRYISLGIVIAIVCLSAPAHAATVEKPSICTTLDTSPTFASVNAIMQTLVADGHSVDSAANILVDTVARSCPQYVGLIHAYVDAGVFLYPELAR